MSEFTTVVIRDAKEPIQLGNLLLGGVISAAATGNLVEEQFRREDAAVAGLGSQDAADQDRSRRNEVAVALGLMNNGDFSWAFLLQKIRECAKASGHEYALPFRLQR